MPLAALERGLAWDWSSFADWMGRLEGAIGVNAGFLCGHSALRRAVMGDDAVGGARPHRHRSARWRRCCRALSARGPWVSRPRPPRPTSTVRPTRSLPARHERGADLARRPAPQPPGHHARADPGRLAERFHRAEIDLMVSMSCSANRPINWNVLGVSSASRDFCEQQLAASSAAGAGAPGWSR